MIYIIADDLTGAADTGVKLKRVTEQVLLKIEHKTLDDSESISSNSGTVSNGTSTKYNNQTADNKIKIADKESLRDAESALVIDSESRYLTNVEAEETLEQILSKLDLHKEDIIYKKIDSTMRGNVAVEIEKIMNYLDKEICIMTPALPDNERIVIGGYLLVGNELLGNSEYYNGEMKQGSASYLPALLKEQTDIPLGLIGLRDIADGIENIIDKIEELYKAGRRIIICDSINNSNLYRIVEACRQSERSILYAGSSGLANQLFHTILVDNISPVTYSSYKDKIDDSGLLVESENRFLITAGTRNNSIAGQIAYLSNQLEISDIKINLLEIFTDREKAISKYFQKTEDAYKNNNYVVLRPDPFYNLPGNMSRFIDGSSDERLPYRQLEIRIRDFLSELSAKIIEEFKLENIMLTGGDTALGVCSFLGIDLLEIEEELIEGVPLSRAYNRSRKLLNIITKAGGFGDERTLYRILRKIRHR